MMLTPMLSPQTNMTQGSEITSDLALGGRDGPQALVITITSTLFVYNVFIEFLRIQNTSSEIRRTPLHLYFN